MTDLPAPKTSRVDRELAVALFGLILMSLGAGLAIMPAAALITFGAGLLAYAIFLAPDHTGGPTP